MRATGSQRSGEIAVRAESSESAREAIARIRQAVGLAIDVRFQALWPLHSLLAVLQALWPLQALAPSSNLSTAC